MNLEEAKKIVKDSGCPPEQMSKMSDLDIIQSAEFCCIDNRIEHAITLSMVEIGKELEKEGFSLHSVVVATQKAFDICAMKSFAFSGAPYQSFVDLRKSTLRLFESEKGEQIYISFEKSKQILESQWKSKA